MTAPDSLPCASVPLAVAPAECMQLRILSGCHQGAVLAISAGERLRVGTDAECDVLLSDCGLTADASLLVFWQADQWWMLSTTQQALAEDPGAALLPGRELGAPASFGTVGATICPQQQPWQEWQPSTAPAQQTVQEPEFAQEPALTAAEEPFAPAEPDHAAVAQLSPLRPARASALRSLRPLAVVAALVIFGGVWALWRNAPASASAQAAAQSPLPAPLSPQAQDAAVKKATLAIALADPSLRLRVAANAEGSVTVSGWVDNNEQYDRLAQALSSLRPLPRLAVRTAQDVLDALSDVGSVHGATLQFALEGGGKVQVNGVVASPEVRAQVLVQLRAHAPEGIDIGDGLRVAALQGPAVKQWLAAQGLTVTQTEWDGEQLVLGVEVNAAQRRRLEQLLAAPRTPLSGVPFVLQAHAAPAPAEVRSLDIADAGLPFRIRSVVGGPAPYVVLANGAKLQPGAGHAGWRLAAIAPDHLVFDGPKRLQVKR